MPNFTLIEPSLALEAEILTFRQAFLDRHLFIHGSAHLADFTEVADWLDYLAAPAGFVRFGHSKALGSTYLLWNESEKRIFGITNIRHNLDEPYIRLYSGHIGYSILPSEQGKGYGTQLLALALEKTDELGIKDVLISCEQHNLASEKVILRNGGEFESLVQRDESEFLKRFWIKR